jgi:hypothetical protein
MRGSVILTAVIFPVDQNVTGLTSSPAHIRVGNRTGNR